MKSSRILSAISFGIIVATPACGANFAPIGKDDAGVGGSGSSVGGASSTDGGANQGLGGKSAVGGSTGVMCHYNNVNYLPGSSVPSSDGCNSCSCTANGEIACTTMACAVGGGNAVGGSTSSGCVCTGPGPASPTFQCWDGSTAGPTCVTNANGSCNWTVTTCPPQPGVGGGTGVGGSTGISGCVTAADCKGALPQLCQQCSDGSTGCAHFACNSGSCEVAYCANSACVCSGPGPESPTVLCADGSTAGPTCVTNATGTCNWTVTVCPVQGVGGSPSVGGSTGVACLYNNVNYAVGSSFKASDGCNSCTCTSSGVACTKMACPVPGTGGASSAGGSSGSGCPTSNLALPKCTTGTAVPKLDPSGCVVGYTCPTCDAIALPAISCANYQIVTDPATGCPTGYTCPVADASVCPPIALAIPICANGSAVLKYDASGCATGYFCP